jgi:hypothetical protein
MIESYCVYYLDDELLSSERRGNNITLKLMWDHMPITGRLYVGHEQKSSFMLPNSYVSNQPAEPMKDTSASGKKKSKQRTK